MSSLASALQPAPNRRAARRIQALYQARIISPRGEVFSALTVNLSRYGAYITVDDERPRMGEHVSLEIELADGALIFDTIGEVVRYGQAHESNGFGLRFADFHGYRQFLDILVEADLSDPPPANVVTLRPGR